MTPKQADTLLNMAQRAKELVQAINSATSVLRYLTRTANAGTQHYDISIYPRPRPPQTPLYRYGTRIRIPAKLAVPQLKAILKTLKQEAKAELDAMPAPPDKR